MKTKTKWITAALVSAGLAALSESAPAQNQAMERDSKIIGTYQGAILPHGFPTPGGYSFVFSGLFTARINFQSLGYHLGNVVQSVFFSNGRINRLSGRIIVSPFSGGGSPPTADRHNRNADYTFETSFEGAVEVEKIQWDIDSHMKYVDRKPGKFFRKLTYEDETPNNAGYNATTSLIGAGVPPAPIFYIGNMTARVEMVRISSRFATASFRPKVQR